MKKNLILLFAIIIIVSLSACSSYKTVLFIPNQDSLANIKCTIKIPKKFEVSHFDEYPYAASWERYYRAYQIEIENANMMNTIIIKQQKMITLALPSLDPIPMKKKSR